MSTRDQIINQVVVGVLAVIIVGGAIVGYLTGRPIPDWLAGAVGAITTASFGATAFFTQARTAVPTAQALENMVGKYHELAMSIPTTPTMTTTGKNAG